MHDSQPEQRGASVPHTWGNIVARRWAPELPRPLTEGFLKTLYALRQLASADGRLSYGDGKGIPLPQIAKAARVREKDARRYLTAAIAAGVVGAPEQRPRGQAVVYSLLACVAPNWAAAVAVLEATKRAPGTGGAPWRERTADEAGQRGEERGTGHGGPELPEETSGHAGPGSGEIGSGHGGPADLGPPWPRDLGPRRPDHPGTSHEISHEVAEVGPQPQDARAREEHNDDSESGKTPGPPERPPLHPVPNAPDGPRPRRARTAVPDGQPPLLLAVPGTPDPPRPHGAAEAYRQGWRALIAGPPTDTTETGT